MIAAIKLFPLIIMANLFFAIVTCIISLYVCFDCLGIVLRFER